jgi:Rad3-related DNA helicase
VQFWCGVKHGVESATPCGAQVRNYGRMLVELAAAIPDGIVCFFVSYSYMDAVVSKWHDMGILQARLPSVPLSSCHALSPAAA